MRKYKYMVVANGREYVCESDSPFSLTKALDAFQIDYKVLMICDEVRFNALGEKLSLRKNTLE